MHAAPTRSCWFGCTRLQAARRHKRGATNDAHIQRTCADAEGVLLLRRDDALVVLNFVLEDLVVVQVEVDRGLTLDADAVDSNISRGPSCHAPDGREPRSHSTGAVADRGRGRPEREGATTHGGRKHRDARNRDVGRGGFHTALGCATVASCVTHPNDCDDA